MSNKSDTAADPHAKNKESISIQPSENHHVFLMIIPYGITKRLLRPMRGISGKLIKFFPNLPKDLKKTDLSYVPADYITAGLMSYALLSSLFGVLIWWLADYRGREMQQSILLGTASAVGLLLIFLIILVRIPSIQSRSRADDIDKHLLYALKDLVLQISSGSTLYDAMVMVSKAGYGSASQLFDTVVRKVRVGIPMRKALDDLANSTDSEYVRKTAWQMINSLRAGADLRITLNSIINDLNAEQKSKILNYSRELNLWSLVYMMFAVAIPTIGSTMMVILSTFAGFGVNQVTFIIFVVICFIVQFILMNFVKARRPIVQF